MKQFVFLTLFLATLCSPVYAQFTQKALPVKTEPRPDSIRVTSTPQLNMQLYNEAYDQYLRQVRFKQRNKILIKNTGISLTQAAFDNWAAGGNNSLSSRLSVHVEHTYTDEKAFNIKSVLDGAISIIQSEGKFKKGEDFWNINIKPNWKIARKWELSGDLLIKSQFASTFQPLTDSTSLLTSSFMAPGELIASAGITYAPPKGKINIYLAPISGNLFMVLNKDLAAKGSFGLEPGRQFKPGFGALFRVIYTEKFAKDKIDYWTKLETFWNYDSDPTIWWENKLNFKFTNLFSLNFYLLAKYNRNETPPRVKDGGTNFWDYWQINQSLGFGIMFNFQSKAPRKIDSQYVKPMRVGKKR